MRQYVFEHIVGKQVCFSLSSGAIVIWKPVNVRKPDSEAFKFTLNPLKKKFFNTD
jgi:hypothetical protein